jgi:DNA-binding response OmpR family regulator
MSSSAWNGLVGKRVLIVEDEAVVAMALEDMLLHLGCVVVGPALRLKAALELASAEPLDGAVLDINLGEDRSFPVAQILAHRNVPFLFATGYGHSGVEPPFTEIAVLAKPYSLAALAGCLSTILAAPAGRAV